MGMSLKEAELVSNVVTGIYTVIILCGKGREKSFHSWFKGTQMGKFPEIPANGGGQIYFIEEIISAGSWRTFQAAQENALEYNSYRRMAVMDFSVNHKYFWLLLNLFFSKFKNDIMVIYN